MAMTDELRLRRYVGDRIPPGQDDKAAFFSNEEIADLLEEANGNLNRAAMLGWFAKMAEFAKLIDTDISGANRRLSQMWKQADAMFRHYAEIIGVDAEAMIGRVVGRAVNLRETPARPRVMAGSATMRSELAFPEARKVMANSHPETTDEDPSYPEPGAVAT